MPSTAETIVRQCARVMTDAERAAAEEIAAWARSPIFFNQFRESACHGGCDQGRPCDCTENLSQTETPPTPASWFSRFAERMAWAIGGVFWLVGLYLLLPSRQ